MIKINNNRFKDIKFEPVNPITATINPIYSEAVKSPYLQFFKLLVMLK